MNHSGREITRKGKEKGFSKGAGDQYTIEGIIYEKIAEVRQWTVGQMGRV